MESCADKAGYTAKPFPEALEELLKERQQPPPFKGVNLREFFDTVPGYGYEHLRKMVGGDRTLTREAIEAMALVLEIEPDYFIEYRVHVVQDILSRRPDLVGQTYESLVNHDRAEAHLEDQRKSKRRRSAASE